jgi:hypothetical protein
VKIELNEREITVIVEGLRKMRFKYQHENMEASSTAVAIGTLVGIARKMGREL